ncbi:MAG: hypothetical protein GMKNLPBB_02726 [Myxococcota bacterium]|nr:hypothetical protein [Myxococcota bacterium]
MLGLATIAVTVLFAWLAMRGIHWGEFWHGLNSISLGALIVFVLMGQIIHWYRVMRIRLLLQPMGGVTMKNCFVAGSVGCFALMVLPFRLGDLVRPYMIARSEGVRMTGVLATVVVERIVDGVVTSALLILSIIGVLVMQQAGSQVYLHPVVLTVAAISTPGFLLGLAFLFYAYYRRQQATALMRAMVGNVAPKLEEKIESMLFTFLDGLQVLTHGGLFGKYLFETVVYWSINALSNSVILYAMGVPGVESIVGGFLTLGLQVVGVLIPAGPAGIGPFEYFSKIGGMALGLTDSYALAFSIVVHTILFIIQIFWGVLFMVTGHVNLRGVVKGSLQDSNSQSGAQGVDLNSARTARALD